jgi:hypothetical protein
MAALSLRSFDSCRQYPADVAGYYSRCPSGKSKTIRLFNLNREAMVTWVRPCLPRETRSLFLWGRPDSMSALVCGKFFTLHIADYAKEFIFTPAHLERILALKS